MTGDVAAKMPSAPWKCEHVQICVSLRKPVCSGAESLFRGGPLGQTVNVPVTSSESWRLHHYHIAQPAYTGILKAILRLEKEMPRDYIETRDGLVAPGFRSNTFGDLRIEPG